MTANFWYIIAGMGTSFVFCAAVLLFYMKYRKNIMQQQYQLEIERMEYRQKLLHSVVEAQEEERKRIAVALHDDMGNRLNILSLLLNSAPPGKDLPDVTGYMSELIGTVRNISHSLYPVNLEKLGLILYIEELVSLLSHKVMVTLHLSNDYQRKNIATEVQLYRIIQEFTTNVVKHSDADEIGIWIRDNRKDMYMILSDNGHSFDYATTRRGMGLKNIEARIKSMNALYKWKNVIGKGSRLIIKIPLNHESTYTSSHH